MSKQKLPKPKPQESVHQSILVSSNSPQPYQLLQVIARKILTRYLSCVLRIA
ncbi:MAG: hypothetical protein QG574_4087 [Cyanobacteriota bacterium erpe_2018_sw_21hr_WHONDRS-SW48-000092_B_bin.40]|jgi:hypothetical protein|nr:hypothetical protein [Cyanobacteriota bacterium erpe_2018_sw_21hr_WHONDRS-SW48-000092_B_bin.40]